MLNAQPASTAVQQPAEITGEIYRSATAVHSKLSVDDRSTAWLREVLG